MKEDSDLFKVGAVILVIVVLLWWFSPQIMEFWITIGK